MSPPQNIRPSASRTSFKKALTELATNVDFREAATKNPTLIVRQYKLSLRELEALRDVAVMSGADITAVDKLRLKEITGRVGGATAADVDVSCCSCCCCCCGETAVSPVIRYP